MVHERHAATVRRRREQFRNGTCVLLHGPSTCGETASRRALCCSVSRERLTSSTESCCVAFQIAFVNVKSTASSLITCVRNLYQLSAHCSTRRDRRRPTAHVPPPSLFGSLFGCNKCFVNMSAPVAAMACWSMSPTLADGNATGAAKGPRSRGTATRGASATRKEAFADACGCVGRKTSATWPDWGSRLQLQRLLITACILHRAASANVKNSRVC